MYVAQNQHTILEVEMVVADEHNLRVCVGIKRLHVEEIACPVVNVDNATVWEMILPADLSTDCYMPSEHACSAYFTFVSSTSTADTLQSVRCLPLAEKSEPAGDLLSEPLNCYQLCHLYTPLLVRALSSGHVISERAVWRSSVLTSGASGRSSRDAECASWPQTTHNWLTAVTRTRMRGKRREAYNSVQMVRAVLLCIGSFPSSIIGASLHGGCIYWPG